VKASAPSRPRRGTEITLGTYRRPPTSCAHRLRKPDRACELLTPSVATQTRARRLLPRALMHPVGWPRAVATAPSRDVATSRLPHRQARRDRRRFRATDERRTRAPSIGSTRTLRPERALPRSLFTCAASPSTLLLATIPSSLVKGRRSASSYPLAPGSYPGCPGAEPRAPRKMLLSDFCNRLHLTSTPYGLFDSRLRARAPPLSCDSSFALQHTGSPWAKGRAVTRLGTSAPRTRRANQVELRLTANLQLRPLPQPITWGSGP
jgi:hypothetical protein